MVAKEKNRFFTFLVYPDSAPEDWKEKLETAGIPMEISPLHDLDLKDKEKYTAEDRALAAAGKPVYKKPHWHVIYIAKNPVTADAVRNKVVRLLGTSQALAQVQIIRSSVLHMHDYLTHSSDDAKKKNKHPYSADDLQCVSGFDIDRYTTLDVEEKSTIVATICDIIFQENLQNVFDLLDYYGAHGQEYGLPSLVILNGILKENSGLFRMYFDGAYQRRMAKVKKLKKSDKRVLELNNGKYIDTVTGQVFEPKQLDDEEDD